MKTVKCPSCSKWYEVNITENRYDFLCNFCGAYYAFESSEMKAHKNQMKSTVSEPPLKWKNFGDIHWAKTLGPDRASRMDACRDAAEIFKNNFAIHSDSPVTPLAPLVTAWCATNRLTEKGKVLGTTQKIDIEQALYCITLGAAYVLKLEREIGSIEAGKKADFCIVNVDPTKQIPEKLRDIEVVDTVFMGIPTSKLKPIHSL